MGASETLNGWKDSQQAFEEAIAAGRLSADPQHPRYAGHYMYMGPYDGRAVGPGRRPGEEPLGSRGPRPARHNRSGLSMELTLPLLPSTAATTLTEDR
jgi:hypothetical protein